MWKMQAHSFFLFFKDTYLSMKQLNYIYHVWPVHYVGQDLFVLRHCFQKYESVFMSGSLIFITCNNLESNNDIAQNLMKECNVVIVS
jgi:hypothetical protein